MSLTDKALKNIGSVQDDPRRLQRQWTDEWFQGIQEPFQHEDPQQEGILSQMHGGISSFWGDVLDLLKDGTAQSTKPITKSLYRLLDDACDTFMVWGDDLNVGSGSLDDSLKDSRDVQQLTIRVLIRITDTLTNDFFPVLLPILRTAAPETSAHDAIQALQAKVEELKLTREKALLHSQSISDADDKSESLTSEGQQGSPACTTEVSPIEDVIESLQSDVEALIDLVPALEDPFSETPSVREEPAPPPKVTAELPKFQPFLDGIKQKYPRCHHSLAQWMSKSLYDTAMRLTQERRVAVSKPADFLRVPGHLPKDSGYGTSIRDTGTNESAGLQESSVVAGSTYARTLASYDDVGDGTTKTPFPSQPKNLSIGDKFPCIACGRQVAKSESASAWKRHLLSDLQPWICCQVACDCLHAPFRTRNEWLVHLQAQHEVHPHWNDKECPVCLRSVPAGGPEMIKHVERHLRQLSLAALTANPGEDPDDSESEHESETPKERRRPFDAINDWIMSHPLHTAATQGEDGLWHCPWEGEGYCDHEPSVLRGDYDKFLKHHFESLRCKVDGCKAGAEAFATQEILHLHEQKEHDMHKGGGRFLCTSPGCGRSRPGNGFASRWVQLEHIKNVHENLSGLPPPADDE
ncbi:hypothetical protein OQA88_5785 [Cercophora sp. LCS_1]